MSRITALRLLVLRQHLVGLIVYLLKKKERIVSNSEQKQLNKCFKCITPKLNDKETNARVKLSNVILDKSLKHLWASVSCLYN